ncbi:MAG: T9SS type A sorting domain-containing protein [Bacteroidota bacterium]
MKNKLLFTIAFLCVLNPVFSQLTDSGYKPLIEGLPDLFLVEYLENDKLFISGNFVSVQDVKLEGAVLLNSDGSLDSEFSREFIATGFVSAITYDTETEKYYVGGDFQGSNDIVRLNSDGTVDETFQLDTVITSVNHIGLQSDGKVIVISFTTDLGIVRLNQDGTLDDTFNNNIGFNNASFTESDLKILADDKILFGGAFSTFNDASFNNILRLNADGTVDDSFSFTGNLTDLASPTVNSVLPLSDGDIIIAGSFDSVYDSTAKSVARLNNDGSLDTDFLLPGAYADVFDRSVRAALDLNENILVSGINTGINNFELVRLFNTGQIDSAFADGDIEFNNSLGTVSEPIIRVRNNGEIYFSANHNNYSNHFSQGLSKLDLNGNVLTSFNADIAGQSSVSAAKQLDDGTILLGGSFTSVNNLPANFLVKINIEGSIDQQFMANIGSGPERPVRSIETDNNGNILLGGGFQTFNNVSTGSFVRMSNNGIIDENFTPSIGSNFVTNGVTEIIVLDNDKIIIGGSFNFVDNNSRNSLAILNSDGSIDTAFDLNLDANTRIESLVLTADNNLFYAGNVGFDGGTIIGMSDLEGNGIESFNVAYDFGSLSIGAAAVMPETGIILVSTVGSGNEPDKVVQFETDGTLRDDTSITTIGSSGVSEILPIDSDNIFIGGQFSTVNETNSPGIGKVNLDGTADPEVNLNLVEIGNFSGPSINSIVDLNGSEFLISGNFSKLEADDFTNTAIVNFDVPKLPTALNGQFAFSTGITLSWNDNSSKETGYELYRKEADGDFALLTTLGADMNTYVDTDLSLTSSYEYRVRAIRNDLFSKNSNEFSIQIPDLPAPDRLNAEFDFTTGVLLSWQDNTEVEESLTVFRATEEGDFSEITMLDANTVSFNDESVALNTAYRYYLRVNSGLFGSLSDTLQFTSPESAMLPTPEISLGMEETSISLEWEYAPTDILGFEIYRSENDNSSFELLAETTDTNFEDLTAAQNIQYFYRIQAFNAFEKSEFSNEVSFVITSTDDELKDLISLYPNPAHQRLSIEVEQSVNAVQILDTNGKVVLVPKDNLISIDISQLENGLYFVQFVSNDLKSVRKLIIQH